MRRSIPLAAAALIVAGCNDITTGGNVANGDAKNSAWHAPDPAVAGQANPTGSDSGPWIGEHGLYDATTGVNDRRPPIAPAPQITLPEPIAVQPSASEPIRTRSGDERDVPAQDPGTIPRDDEQRAR